MQIIVNQPGPTGGKLARASRICCCGRRKPRKKNAHSRYRAAQKRQLQRHLEDQDVDPDTYQVRRLTTWDLC